ncbi:MAG TPA: phage tail sheath C-terminal domain-containing protein [Albitalea sp.]
MPVAVSYPGVYVQEIASGVRTIVGVGTSIGMFIGRAKTGQMNVPVQCLSYEDFVRNFSAADAGGDLMRAVKLFFTNGGTQCYVMRIARNALAASVMLSNDTNTFPVLQVEAKSAGLFGDDIRLAVSYNTQLPEATFNLEVFRWTKTSTGALQRSGIENYVALSMDPTHPRYAPDIVSSASALVTLIDQGAPPAVVGFSQSGFAVSARTDAIFRTQWMALVGAAATTNRFRISVDGNASVEVDLSSLDFAAPAGPTNPNPLNTPATARANLPGRIEQLINAALPAGSTTTVTMQVGPAGPAAQDNLATVLLRIESANGDVLIDPAANLDCAVPLMLGTAQGGREVSRYAGVRPAPTGYATLASDALAFGALPQAGAGSFDTLVINGIDLDLSAAGAHPIATLTDPPITEPRMYQDGSASNQNDGRDGIREKLAIIAAAINDRRLADSDFGFSAEVWGDRLAIAPTSGSDNTQIVVSTELAGVAGPALSAGAVTNVRYYALGITGFGPFQGAGSPGNDGIEPDAASYENAYLVIDREVDLFNLLVLPKDRSHSDAATRKLWGPASVFCLKRRAFLLMDPPDNWTDQQSATSASVGVNTLRVGLVKDHSAVFFPQLKIDEAGKDVFVGPSGAIAGLMARIDGTRGVWKAPAGTEADLRGVTGVKVKFSDDQNGVLNPKAVNTIRVFPNGIVNWGARTMDGDDGFGSEYKYIPIRRLALYIEESLYRGLKWVVFEPNDEPLWSQIRLNVGAFMNNLYRQGAFQGASPRDAYFVKCDASTTTQNDRNLGIVNIVVGFAPLKPAEFVVLTLQQMAGQIQT